jgi:hypothetical protein
MVAHGSETRKFFVAGRERPGRAERENKRVTSEMSVRENISLRSRRDVPQKRESGGIGGGIPAYIPLPSEE